MTNATRSSLDDTVSFTSKLKLLPVATVREKLNFPLKFEKQSFCLDFRSAGGSATSDCEPTSLRQYRIGKREGPATASRASSIKAKIALKKKFSSAEKVKKSHLIGNVLSPSSLASGTMDQSSSSFESSPPK